MDDGAGANHSTPGASIANCLATGSGLTFKTDASLSKPG